MWWRLLQAQTIQEMNSKTGIYFDQVGTILFYPTKWKVVTYINLEPTRELWKQTKLQQRRVADFCKKIKNENWYRYTDCIAFDQYVKSKNKYIDNLKDLVVEYLSAEIQNPGHRSKRGVMNFVGEISKILFGTLTQSDARDYNEHISELEKEQKEFLHLANEQMTIIKTTVSSVNSTLQRVNQNEKVLETGLNKLLNYSNHKFYEMTEEMENVNLINEQFRLIQRGIDECQHSFETLIEAFVHAEQGTLQPQFITAEKIRNLIATQRLPSGLDYPNFPFPELSKIITPKIYSYKKYLVYVLEIPLFSPNEYHLYKLLPFPVSVQKESSYGYINFNKEFIFSDVLRQHYGKMTSNELLSCFQPNEITFVCKEDIPIYTYVPEVDCEATLLHPSSTKVPESCDYRFLKLRNAFWIPLHLSNQWLFVTPHVETFTVLCSHETTTLKLQGEGKLTLMNGCKGYSSYVTLYAVSNLVTNATSDYVPSAPVDFNDCFEEVKLETFENLPLHAPLVNVMSSADDLRIASMKADEVQQLIKQQEQKHSQYLYAVATSWGSVFGAICLFFMCICCSFCWCKCCRNCAFWLWDKWSPRECWHQAREKCCVNIHNYNCPDMAYAKTDTPSPAVSLKSLPELEDAITSKVLASTSKERAESVALRTRSKINFR
jgi:hypothetical protein